MNTPTDTKSDTRRYPMRKPGGHTPVIQRYSSVLEEQIRTVRVVVFGQQGGAQADFLTMVQERFDGSHTPAHWDLAHFTDPEGYQNAFAVGYWLDPGEYEAWRVGFDAWWDHQDAATAQCGLWLETFSVPTPYRETIAFKEYLRGLSACPYSKIQPMSESAYWGAARDRFAASAFDSLGPQDDRVLSLDPARSTKGRKLRVTGFPEKLCMIRSGVTWEACGAEQLASYRNNLAPKLDAGMDYLRNHPSETGCASLRQVVMLHPDGFEAPEAYSMGFFLSFKHLEDWAEYHPSHLAIYTRALAERKKYGDKLELKTYHEIYVLNDDAEFLYLNCHPNTGLLPYFETEQA